MPCMNNILKNPEITKQRMFYETMEDVLPDLKRVINGSDTNINTILPLENMGTQSSTQGIISDGQNASGSQSGTQEMENSEDETAQDESK